MGAETKLKAGLAGEEKGKPPCGCRDGKVSRRPTGHAPPPPPGTWTAETVSAASGLTPGCRGRSPRRNKVKISPFPGGEGGQGDGGKKSMIWQEKQARQGTAPLRVPGRQGQQATNRASPPTGDMGAG